jgi:spore coat polysaccharide biosynthesis protein SpsF
MTEHKVGIILQARMGSTRLPGKVLLPFVDTNLLGWILHKLSDLPWPVVVATSNLDQDTEIADYCAKEGVSCFRGSEKDVLDRYYQCAIKYDFNHVIRLTADNPFPDTDELSELVKLHIGGAYDYSHNIGMLPVGVGAEILSLQALSISWREGLETQHREHVNEFILEQPERFSIGYLDPPLNKKCPKLSLTIDTESDYQRIHALVTGLASFTITTEKLIKQCSLFA